MKLSRFFWQTGVILGGKCVTKFDTESEEEKGSKKRKEKRKPKSRGFKKREWEESTRAFSNYVSN